MDDAVLAPRCFPHGSWVAAMLLAPDACPTLLLRRRCRSAELHRDQAGRHCLLPCPQVWAAYINPVQWSIYGLSISQLGQFGDENITGRGGGGDGQGARFAAAGQALLLQQGTQVCGLDGQNAATGRLERFA